LSTPRICAQLALPPRKKVLAYASSPERTVPWSRRSGLRVAFSTALTSGTPKSVANMLRLVFSMAT